MGGLKNIGNSILGYFGMSLDNFKLEKGPGGGYNVQFKQWLFIHTVYFWLILSSAALKNCKKSNIIKNH